MDEMLSAKQAKKITLRRKYSLRRAINLTAVPPSLTYNKSSLSRREYNSYTMSVLVTGTNPSSANQARLSHLIIILSPMLLRSYLPIQHNPETLPAVSCHCVPSLWVYYTVLLFIIAFIHILNIYVTARICQHHSDFLSLFSHPYAPICP